MYKWLEPAGFPLLYAQKSEQCPSLMVPILHHTKPRIGLSCGKMWMIWDWISRRQGKVKVLALGEAALEKWEFGVCQPMQAPLYRVTV